jgi:hypothetical protein
MRASYLASADVLDAAPTGVDVIVHAPTRRRIVPAITVIVAALVLSVGLYGQGASAGRRAAEQAAQSTAEAAYLAVLRAAPVNDSLLPEGLSQLTDRQLLGFGWRAGRAYRAGSTVTEMAQAVGDLIVPVPDKPGLEESPPNPYLPLIVDTASRELCPQYVASSEPGPPEQRWEVSQ